jgi:hypothetical protein
MEEKGIQTEIGNYNREIKAHNATVKSIKNLIVSLEAWFAGKGKASALFAKEVNRPPCEHPQHLWQPPQARTG